MIRSVSFIDAAMFTASMLTRYKEWTDQDGKLHTRDGGPRKLPSGWKSATGLLTKIKNAVAPVNDGKPGVLGNVWIDELPPHQSRPWVSAPDEADILRLELCLVPSPGAWVFSGGHSVILPVGQLTYVDHRVLNSAVNFGPCRRIHLVAEIIRQTET